jgi:aminoglycoside phosphotransferase (APT) family kinase protein
VNDRDNIAALVAGAFPRSRLLRVRKLRGGVDALMHVLDTEQPAGRRTRVVLRRYVDGHRTWSPGDVVREAEVLRFVVRAGVPAPRVLFQDLDGTYFGVPAMVLSYLPGCPVVVPGDATGWASQLAGAIAHVHRATATLPPPAGLPVRSREWTAERIAGWRDWARADPLAVEIQQFLGESLDCLELPRPRFIHGDYWSGNTVWLRGNLTGVVDWSSSRLGDVRADISECRIDAVMTQGMHVADVFLREYERYSGAAVAAA